MNQVEAYKHLEESQAHAVNIQELFSSPLHLELVFKLSDSLWVAID